MQKSAYTLPVAASACFAAVLFAAQPAFAAMTVTNVPAGGTFTFTAALNDTSVEVVLNAGATMVLPASGNVHSYVYMKGSGAVTFQKPGSGYQGGDQVRFWSGIAADGSTEARFEDVTTVNVGRLNVTDDLHYPVVDVANMSFAQSGGKVRLVDKTTVRKLPAGIDFEVADGATVALQGTDPLGMGAAFALTDYDLLVLNRDSVPSGCAISVAPGRTLGLKPTTAATRDGNSTYKWNWSGAGSYFNETFRISLGGKGARVLCRNNNRMRLFTPVTGVGEVVFRPDTNSGTPQLVFRGRTYVAYKSAPVSIPVNTAAEPAIGDTWQGKVSHWFDASDADTVVPFSFDPSGFSGAGWATAKNEFNGNQIVIGWKDKVPGSGISFYNSRIWDKFNAGTMYNDYNLQVMPYLVEDGLNGKPYISFGGFNTANLANAKYNGSGNLASATEARRLWVWNNATPSGNAKSSGAQTTINPKYCILVFGSQQGGGRTVLGDDVAGGSGNLGRGGTTLAYSWTLYNSGCSWMIDGVSTNSTTAKPNGVWQIVSLDMTATNILVKGLGVHNTDNQYGGQNYAEIIFFDEAPTEAERMACESYLAGKWGLASTYSFRAGTEAFSELSGGAGTTVEIGDYSTDDLTGSATTYPTPDEVMIAGNYKGTINVAAGKTLVVSDRAAPPDAYDLPQPTNIVAWFDPSLDGALDFHQSAEAATGVARLYSRTAVGVDKSEGAYWMGMQAQKKGDTHGIANKIGRYPFLVDAAYSSASGVAPTMPWMNFTVNAAGESNGNTLRSHVLPDLDVEQTAASPMTFRSLFMALDSSAGGGNPVGDKVGFDGKIKARAAYGEDYTQPIWNSGTVAMAHTWLDTNEVNGATAGYSGRGEVLGFEAAADLTTDAGLFFGYYNPSHGETNYEHIAETVIYSTALADAERQIVQKYLMAKRFGDMNAEFSDLSGATVTGAGDVKSATLRNLPTFDAGFTGGVSGGSAMTFRLYSDGNGTAVLDPIAIDHAVTLDATCAITVTVSGGKRPAPGTYTLLDATSLSGGTTLNASIVNNTDAELPSWSVRKDGNRILFEVVPSAFVFVVR